MTNPNADYNRAARAPVRDPVDEPGFDYQGYIDQVMEAVARRDPVVVFRQQLRERANRAGFVDFEVRHLNKGDYWDLRCRRRPNAQCRNDEDVERWLEYVARESGRRLVPGRVVALVLDDRVAAKFALEAAEPVLAG